MMNNNKKQIYELASIIWSVEREFQYRFRNDEVLEILAYTIRKCERLKKDDSYIPILFETELQQYVAGLYINTKGIANKWKKAKV